MAEGRARRGRWERVSSGVVGHAEADGGGDDEGVEGGGGGEEAGDDGDGNGGGDGGGSSSLPLGVISCSNAFPASSSHSSSYATIRPFRSGEYLNFVRPFRSMHGRHGRFRSPTIRQLASRRLDGSSSSHEYRSIDGDFTSADRKG